jgi:glycosyltransferase involved in cell wall biosynthesis
LDTLYGKKIKLLVDRNSMLEDAVQFVGMITGDTKWGAFYGCEAFVLPSHQENFGIAVAEALACGKPVLISNKINIWREIEAAGGGMVADDTLEATTRLLDKWCSLSKEVKLQYTKQAYECYQKHFAVAPATQQFLEAIK